MKQFCCLLTLALALVMVGCGTPSAYKTLRALSYTEQGAVYTAAVMVEFNQITEEDWLRVVRASDVFGTAWSNAVLFLKVDPDRPAPKEVQESARAVMETVADLERKAKE